MREVAGGAAVLVDPEDVASIRAGILHVLEDDALRTCLVRRGFQNVERYEPRRIAERYGDVYRSVFRGIGLVRVRTP